ncbi:hypothetical protein ILUMI_10726 [Ignelater luminosus]|uniref:Uncharacterized protein n=1 Tax=Ignelater luminosus TaxID=2038154 RepID=A0A8K0GDD1_IGNLU|nr:hypothetical protein ILUMI_10726 [Ignelater luminosus]
MGTSRRDTSTWPSPGFSRSEGKIRTPPQLRCSSRSKPYLPARGFHGTRTLMQKRKLFPDLPTASSGHLGLPRRTLLRGPDLLTVPLPGSGIGTGFPFARRTRYARSHSTDSSTRGGRAARRRTRARSLAAPPAAHVVTRRDCRRASVRDGRSRVSCAGCARCARARARRGAPLLALARFVLLFSVCLPRAKTISAPSSTSAFA